jgi:hypothetical protein
VASVPTEPVTAERFAGFNDAGFGKIAESTRVDAYGERFSIKAFRNLCFEGASSSRPATAGAAFDTLLRHRTQRSRGSERAVRAPASIR